VISTLKLGKGPDQPLSYLPISLLGTTGKLFQNFLLNRTLYEFVECGLLWEKQYRFRTRHRTSLLLARFVERITKSFGANRLSGAVLPNGAKAFDF
jgi:hypothetical protein